MRLTIFSSLILALATLLIFYGQINLHSESPFGEITPEDLSILLEVPNTEIYFLEDVSIQTKPDSPYVIVDKAPLESDESTSIYTNQNITLVQTKDTEGEIASVSILNRDILAGDYEVDLAEINNKTLVSSISFPELTKNYDFYGIGQNFIIFIATMSVLLTTVIMLSHKDPFKERRFVLFSMSSLAVMSGLTILSAAIDDRSYVAGAFVFVIAPIWLVLITIYAVLNRDKTNGKSEEQVFE
jgi:hypothetical protein